MAVRTQAFHFKLARDSEGNLLDNDHAEAAASEDIDEAATFWIDCSQKGFFKEGLAAKFTEMINKSRVRETFYQKF